MAVPIKAFPGAAFTTLLAASSYSSSSSSSYAIATTDSPYFHRLITANTNAAKTNSSSSSSPIMVAKTLNAIPQARAKKFRPEFKMVGNFKVDDGLGVRGESSPYDCFLADYAKGGFIVSGDNQFEEEIPAEIRGCVEKYFIPAFQKSSYCNYNRVLECKEYAGDHNAAMPVLDIVPNGSDASHEGVMLDENMLYFKPNPDNKLVACAEVSKVDQVCTVYIVNAESLEPVGKPLEGSVSYVEWAGNESLVYITTDDTFRPDKVWLHKVGREQSSDSCLYHERDAMFSLHLHASKSKKYLFVTSESKTARCIYYLDVQKLEEGLKIMMTYQLDGVDKSVSRSGSHFFVKHDEPFSSELLTHSTDKAMTTRLFTQNTRRRSFWAAMKMAIDETASFREGILVTWIISYLKLLLSLTLWKNMFKLINMFLLILLMPFNGSRRHCVVIALDSVDKEKNQKSKVIIKKDKQGLLGSGKHPTKLPTVNPSPHPVDLGVLVRRQMAIQRIREDKDDIDKTTRDFSLFVTPRGVTLFAQSWTPVSCKIKGFVLVLHGLNEHSGRYNSFAKQLNANGFKVFGLDWIGHGGSDGLHGYVHSLNDAVSDVKAFLDEISAQNLGTPCFCFGHSTGAAILLKAALDPKFEAKINGLVLTSPAIGVQPSHPIYTILAPIMSILLPRYQCGAANKKGAVVSRDPEAVLAKYSDPLVYTGSLRVRTGYEILRISTYLQRNLRRLKVPFLVLHGTADVITNPEASEKLYMEASSTDKKIKLYEGLLHDLLFEPERETIVHDIMEWLVERT